MFNTSNIRRRVLEVVSTRIADGQKEYDLGYAGRRASAGQLRSCCNETGGFAYGPPFPLQYVG